MPREPIPEDSVSYQLHPDSYEPVETGGRWFNMPGRHPVTGQVFNEDQAVDFALENGLLGIGYDSVDQAVQAAVTRAELGDENPLVANRRELPFNPGGRALDGFLYPELDTPLMETAIVRSGRDREMQSNFEKGVIQRAIARPPEEVQTILGEHWLDVANDAMKTLIGEAPLYPARAPGSEQSYTFERFDASGRRLLRYSDRPEPQPGEQRIP